MRHETQPRTPDRKTQRALMRLRTTVRIAEAFGKENDIVAKEVDAAERALKAGDTTRASAHVTRARIEHNISERLRFVFGEDSDKNR